MVGSMNGVSRIAMHDSSASDVRPKAEAPLLGIDPTIVANKEQHTPAAVSPATMPADGPNLREFAADEAPAKKAPAAGGGKILLI